MKFLLSIFFTLSASAGVIFIGGFQKLTDYDLCQDNSSTGKTCDFLMKEWVDEHPADAWKAAKMTRKKMNARVALPYFDKAKDSKDFDCKDEDLKLAVISALNVPYEGNEVTVNAAKDIGLAKCKKELGDAITSEASMDSFSFANACDKMDLQGLKKKKCETLKGKK